MAALLSGWVQVLIDTNQLSEARRRALELQPWQKSCTDAVSNTRTL